MDVSCIEGELTCKLDLGTATALIEYQVEHWSNGHDDPRRHGLGATGTDLVPFFVLKWPNELALWVLTRSLDPTVGKWRSRFVSKRLMSYLDEPRPGAPRTVNDAKVERVIALTLESTPPPSHPLRDPSIAERSRGPEPYDVHRIWRAFALQPHRSETFKLSTDPLFIDKVRDIVGLYLNPPDRVLVLCDEKTQ